MPSEIVWLPGASRDVDRLRAFLRPKNPLAANRAAKRIIEGVMMLRDNPEAGTPVEDLMAYHDLKLNFSSGEYIIRYRKEDDRVVIVRVRHSKEEGF